MKQLLHIVSIVFAASGCKAFFVKQRLLTFKLLYDKIKCNNKALMPAKDRTYTSNAAKEVL